MLLIVGTIRLPVENVPAARPVLKAMVEGSRAEEGCLEYSYAEDLFEPGLVNVRSHCRLARLMGRLGIGNRNLVAYEVGEPRST